jgi:hypothetical protein
MDQVLGVFTSLGAGTAVASDCLYLPPHVILTGTKHSLSKLNEWIQLPVTETFQD